MIACMALGRGVVKAGENLGCARVPGWVAVAFYCRVPMVLGGSGRVPTAHGGSLWLVQQVLGLVRDVSLQWDGAGCCGCCQPSERASGCTPCGAAAAPTWMFFTCPPQEAGSRGWLDVVLAAPGLAKLGISPMGTQRCWGKAAFDQNSSRGKVSEPCSFWEHAAEGRFPIQLCPILALLELHIRVMLKRSVRVLSC